MTGHRGGEEGFFGGQQEGIGDELKFAPPTRSLVSASMLASAKCSVAKLALVLPFRLRERGFSGGRSRCGRGGSGRKNCHVRARHLD